MERESVISDLRIASFAVYLNPGDDSFVKKLMESTQHPSPVSVIPNEDPPVPIRTCKDGEIGVFGAEKYFNMNLDDSIKSPSLISDDGMNLRVMKENPPSYCSSNVRRETTPSIHSESSWTTQSTFLRSFKRNLSHNKARSAVQKGFFSGLSCYKSCNDRKSIYTVPHAVLETGGSRKHLSAPASIIPAGHEDPFLRSEKSSRTGSKRIMRQPFSFPVMTNEPPHITGKKMESARPSLEVFRLKPNTSKAGQNDIVAMNLERKLSVLTWDAIPTTTQIPSSIKSCSVVGFEEDMTSEASADLFEIDNISGVGEDMPPCMYAPSEASIEWSVVTASAADFLDYNMNHKDIHPFHLIPSSRSNKSNFKGVSNQRGEDPKGRQSGLLGCKNYKAVQVAETTVGRATPKKAAA